MTNQTNSQQKTNQSTRTPGICLTIGYIAPRKRNPRSMDFVGANLAEAKAHVTEFLRKHPGKITYANVTGCTRWSFESDGETISMYERPLFAECIIFSLEEIANLYPR